MSNVTHPSHYNSGKIEVIVFIEDQKLDFHSGNAVKYISRAGRKDPTKEIEDLEKASWYIKRKIELLKAAKENREPIPPNDMNPKTASAPSSSSATSVSTSKPPEGRLGPALNARRAHFLGGCESPTCHICMVSEQSS